MTAEIAILNKSAVALAADSAMSLGISGKIFPGNKLFALTKWHPVGVMIYNNAEYMGIPWETIIKIYRLELGKHARPSIQDYVDGFLAYLQSDHFSTEEQVKNNFLEIANDEFEKIWRTVKKSERNLNSDGNSLSVQDRNKLIVSIVEERLLELIEETDDSELIQNSEIETLVSKYRSQIDELIEQIFHGLEVTESVKSDILKILRISTKSKQMSGSYTGIVIAGFGDEEIFPSVIEVVVDGMIGKNLKYKLQQKCQIGQDTDAAVIPFAQGEMVNRFMEGVDPEFLKFLYMAAENILNHYGQTVRDESNQHDNQKKETIENSLKVMMQNFHEILMNYCQVEFVQPITHVIRHLPKEELGGMAEALVSLTSLKRRVSFEQETVGGPVDVAIISKGDGFIWQKRKHYFESTLNPSYLNRQFVDVYRGGKLNEIQFGL